MKTVVCRNHKTGELAEFIYSKDVVNTDSIIPYSVNGSSMVWRKGEVTAFSSEGWCYANPVYWERRCWDLRPLELEKERPDEKAFLGYNTNTDSYDWFIRSKDCERYRDAGDIPTPMRPYRLTATPDADNMIWRYSGPYGPTHNSDAGYAGWQSQGYVFILLEDKEETMSTDDVKLLQRRLMEYCSQKPTRWTHLTALQCEGALNTDAPYETVRLIILNYLKNTEGICEDGVRRAKEFLVLKEEKWVEKTMRIADVLKLDTCKVRIPVAVDTDGGFVGNTSLDDYIGHDTSHAVVRDTIGDLLPSGMRIVVEVLEES